MLGTVGKRDNAEEEVVGKEKKFYREKLWEKNITGTRMSTGTVLCRHAGASY
jgi:hypothetical protein